MKRNTFLQVMAMMLFIFTLSTKSIAQAPHKMTFQSVVRNSSGALVVSSTVGMQITILHDSATGTPAYVEQQFPVTNANGLATIMIGTGTVISGSFDSINWAMGPYYIKAETDPTGGTAFSITATQQLVSVPYALYAEHSGDTNTGTRPVVTTDSTNTISYTTATFYGNITGDGGELVLFRGVCVDTVPMPTIGNSFVTPGSMLGSYHVNISGLLPNNLYYARAFATNSNGTSYGSVLSFSTLPLSTPTVTTDTVNGISNVSANGGGTVTSDGGNPVTDRGICWNTTGSPTTASSIAPSGSGLGHFLTTLSSLTPTTTYYVRAYATNALGTAYGNQDTFSTVVYTYATIATDTITSIFYNNALSGVNVISDGGSTITAQGICWSTSVNPTIANPHINTTTGLGDYPATLYCSPGTTYYVRAFCTNATGTIYGAQRVFTSLPLSAPVLSTNSIIGVTAASATSGGHITLNGGSYITASGVCYGTGAIPTIDSLHTTDGISDTGIYNSNLSGLNPLTTYYLRAYATNSSGTGYGAVISFTTDTVVTVVPSVPVVGTSFANITTPTSGSEGGYVLNSSGSTVTARGICWGTSTAPTISGPHTTDGTGLGYFTSTITGLTGCGTVYHVRAYATNSTGTGYGNEDTFATGSPLMMTANPISSITTSSFTAGGNISSDGGCPITERGIVYIVAYDTFDIEMPMIFTGFTPWISDSISTIIPSGTGTGIYSANVTGLRPGVTYYVRTYAINAIGTVYGPRQTVTTAVPSSGHYIGENFAGGRIFYLDGTGNHGMVCGPRLFAGSRDLSWGCESTYIGATDSTFGAGATNTAAIVAGCLDTTSAAYSCATFSLAGYSDWYLPSVAEMRLIKNNLGNYGLIDLKHVSDVPPPPFTGFQLAYYSTWTSTEIDAYHAYKFNEHGNLYGFDVKSNNNYAYPVRIF